VCGIAGIIDLRGVRQVNPASLERMSATLIHRGPDEQGFLLAEGLGLASRRLSIVGLADGRQPIANEDGTVTVVFNGELFDFREQRAALIERGHRFRTSCDTEILVHLWEEYGEGMFHRLRGQFAVALFDHRQKQLILARDRVGICPLHWARSNDWLLFGSEIKALLASGEVAAQADLCGLDHIFTFFAMPSRRTMFAGISAVQPGTFLKVQLRGGGQLGEITEHTYWDLDFPDSGDELDSPNEAGLVDEFQETFFRAVDSRLRADVPVVSYLSGGVDSATVLASSAKVRGRTPPSFTIRIASPRFDETAQASAIAAQLDSKSTVVHCDSDRLAAAYPKVILAADCPVIDTACAALYCLAEEVHRQGFKVALTGEGADEALAGYPWFKIDAISRVLDHGWLCPGAALEGIWRRLRPSLGGFGEAARIEQLCGGAHAQTKLYHLVSSSRRRFYSQSTRDQLAVHSAYEDLSLNLARMKRWHPLNQSLYMGYKTILPGLLLNHKGDRVAMAHSVETRYPFLDEDLIAFCARLHPRHKLRGLRRDKYILRQFASRLLPTEMAQRPKAMFRAPFADTFFATSPPYVEQLLSPESLARTPYFDPERVLRHYEAYRRGGALARRRVFVEMGLVSVLATQLWHHLYLGGGLCDLPTWSASPPASQVAFTSPAR
jgi:asparagine synthase (glutamine-hydrolysing)